MLVGIMSDTHDHVAMIAQAVDECHKRGVSMILHAGDWVAPFAARALATANLPVRAVFGNNDGEKDGLRNVFPNIDKGPVQFDLDGHTVVMAHDATKIPASMIDDADIVITGHTHHTEVVHRDGALWINPGEVCGWVKRQPTMVVLDTSNLTTEVVELTAR